MNAEAFAEDAGGAEERVELEDLEFSFAAFFVDHAGADHDELVFFDEVSVFAEGFGEHDDGSGAFEAFDAEGGHRFLLFAGVEFADVGDHAAEAGLVAVLECFELVEVGEGAVLEGPLVACEGVAGDVEADEFAFGGEEVGFGPGGAVGKLFIRVLGEGLVGDEVEDGALSGFFVAGGFGGAAEGDIDAFEEAGAVHVGEVEGSGADEAFDHFTVGAVEADAEVHETGEGAVGIAVGDDLFDEAFADAFDGGEAEADGALVDGVEAGDGFVDGGGEHLEVDFGGFGDEVGELVGVGHFAGEEGGHEFAGVVGFEPGGLIGDEAVGGGVGFVEAVLGKFFDVVEDGAGELGFDLVGFLAAGDKFFALGGHDFGFLFAHGAAEDVALSEGEAGEGLGGLLNLFLVDDDAVGFVEDGFEQGVVVLYVFGAVFAAGEAFDELHGAGAVEGEDGDDVLYAVGGDLAEGVAHAGGFELEDADGVAAGE